MATHNEQWVSTRSTQDSGLRHSGLPRVSPSSRVVAERIAAGEVIETPAAVVKELVENALDAGARQIMVDIRGGGLEQIRVTDNGGGIAADQVALAFQRHATSKLRDLDDLLRVRTLGFRGEALPSIAAVADVTIHTATDGAPAGTVLRFQERPGRWRSKRARSRGTTVTVRDLFAAIPARRRFLRTPRARRSRSVRRCAASRSRTRRRFHPRLRRPHRLPHAGTGVLAETAAALFGPAVALHLSPLEVRTSVGEITGVIGDRADSRPGRNSVTLIVNGRNVKCPPLALFETAYGPCCRAGGIRSRCCISPSRLIRWT